ncbi:MAG: LptF/LptG family permease, partial [Helicobacteraceae bacterium]|nr:LptF/LptG family permease [Helicobacteraceae bacterium]
LSKRQSRDNALKSERISHVLATKRHFGAFFACPIACHRFYASIRQNFWNRAMLDRYIAGLYIRYSVLVLSALLFFFVGIDFINAFGKLPNSANLILLYMIFYAAQSLNVVFPLSFIFGAIITKMHLVKANELVAFYSLGASQARILRAFAVVSLGASALYIAAFMTEFAYLGDHANAIKNNRLFASATKDIFLKYDNHFIYIKELLPLENSANNIDILEIKDGDLTRYISSGGGVFENNAWQLKDVTVTTKPRLEGLDTKGINVQHYDTLVMLEGFRPDIMDSIYESKMTYNLIDAVRAWTLLSKQNINTNRIRAIFYSTIVSPLFSSLLVAVIFIFLPISARFFNMAMYGSLSVLLALVVWGALYSLAQVAKNGALLPEIALLLPFALAIAIVGFLLKKKL